MSRGMHGIDAPFQLVNGVASISRPTAEDLPGHIRPQVFAANRALGRSLNAGTVFCRYAPAGIRPLADGRSGHAEKVREACFAADNRCGLIDGIRVHPISLDFLHLRVKNFSPCMSR